MSTRPSWQTVIDRIQNTPITRISGACDQMRDLADAYDRVEVETLTADDYLLLYPQHGVLERCMMSATSFVRALTGSCWDHSVWSDADFLGAHETLRTAEASLEQKLKDFALAVTRAWFEDQAWRDMIRAEFIKRGGNPDRFEDVLAKARRDATTGIASGWVWIKAGDLLNFYRQLDQWRDITRKTSPLNEETSHAA